MIQLHTKPELPTAAEARRQAEIERVQGPVKEAIRMMLSHWDLDKPYAERKHKAIQALHWPEKNGREHLVDDAFRVFCEGYFR